MGCFSSSRNPRSRDQVNVCLLCYICVLLTFYLFVGFAILAQLSVARRFAKRQTLEITSRLGKFLMFRIVQWHFNSYLRLKHVDSKAAAKAREIGVSFPQDKVPKAVVKKNGAVESFLFIRYSGPEDAAVEKNSSGSLSTTTSSSSLSLSPAPSSPCASEESAESLSSTDSPFSSPPSTTCADCRLSSFVFYMLIRGMYRLPWFH